MLVAPIAAPTVAPAGFHLGHRRWLDGLRGVAILLVLLFHLHLASGGFLGVDVFFVLSGFLITCLLAEEYDRRQSIDLRRFYMRRILRLLPAFFVFLVVGYVIVRLTHSADEETYLWGAVVSATYVANWPTLHRTAMPLLGHTWSLAVEEQFYLLWPVLLYGLLRVGVSRRAILIGVGLGIVAAATDRAVLFELRPPQGPDRELYMTRLYMGLDTRADALLVGCLIGLTAVWGRLPRSAWAVTGLKVASPMAIVGLAYMVSRSSPDHHNLYLGLFTATALMVGTIIVRQLVAPSRLAAWVLESAPLVGLGRISYALYLYHVPVIEALGPSPFGWETPGKTLLAAGLSIAAAIASFYLVEKPFLRLKKRWSGGV